MFKKLVTLAAAFTLASCGPMTAVLGTQSNSLMSTNSPSPLSSSVPVSYLELSSLGQHVSMHPLSTLRSKGSCTHIITLRFTARQNYRAALIEVRNRAGLIGANAAAIDGFYEVGSTTQYVAHFYDCKDKKKL
jgi:hypothetical protein